MFHWCESVILPHPGSGIPCACCRRNISVSIDARLTAPVNETLSALTLSSDGNACVNEQLSSCFSRLRHKFDCGKLSTRSSSRNAVCRCPVKSAIDPPALLRIASVTFALSSWQTPVFRGLNNGSGLEVSAWVCTVIAQSGASPAAKASPVLRVRSSTSAIIAT